MSFLPLLSLPLFPLPRRPPSLLLLLPCPTSLPPFSFPPLPSLPSFLPFPSPLIDVLLCQPKVDENDRSWSERLMREKMDLQVPPLPPPLYSH